MSHERTYTNPIIPGYHPDPTICRVGEDYYLVNSTFEHYPGLPIHHSRDLVNWRPIGHVLDRPSQLPLDGVRPSGGLYAPAIRHHDGRFYVTCTLVDGTAESGHFIVVADDPAGPWSDPVWLPGAHIDPSPFFDDDGTAWFVANRKREEPDFPGHTEIWLRRLSLDPLELTGDDHVLWDGAVQGGVWSEGPHLLRRGPWYYLVTAEGGTHLNHAIVVARSREVTGPYESCPWNPVLTHRHLGRTYPVAAIGHTDLVETQTGEWWAVMLGIRLSGGIHHNLGRETFLAPVVWEDDWPVFCPGEGRVPVVGRAPALPPHPWPRPAERDDFDGAELASHWLMVRTPRERWWSLDDRPGHLRLQARPERLTDRANPSLVMRRQQHLVFRAETELDFTPVGDDDRAGLTVFHNETHHVRVEVARDGDGRHVEVVRCSGGDEDVLGSRAIADGPVRLWASAHGQDYRVGVIDAAPGNGGMDALALGGDDGQLASFDGRILSTEVAGGFTGTMVGVFATSQGGDSTATVDVGWFSYAGEESPLASA